MATAPTTPSLHPARSTAAVIQDAAAADLTILAIMDARSLALRPRILVRSPVIASGQNARKYGGGFAVDVAATIATRRILDVLIAATIGVTALAQRTMPMLDKAYRDELYRRIFQTIQAL